MVNEQPQSSLAVIQDIFTDAIRYWEKRRIAYNVVLGAVVLAWLGLTWPHFREAIALPTLGLLVVLAVIANICYSAAYIADIPMQISALRSNWRRWRWGLWLAGTLLAILIENYWISDGIYPYVGQ